LKSHSSKIYLQVYKLNSLCYFLISLLDTRLSKILFAMT